MKGTLVLRAACATVANSPALVNPSAATSSRVPRLNTGLSRSWIFGSDAPIVGLAAAAAGFFVMAARAGGCGLGAGGCSAAVAAEPLRGPLFHTRFFSDGPIAKI